MNNEFTTTACRSIITLWAATYELEILHLRFPEENTAVVYVLLFDRLPVLAVAKLSSFLGSGIEVKTTISRGGLNMAVTINNYQIGRIAELWQEHERFLGR